MIFFFFCGQAEEVITIPFSLGRRAQGLAGESAGGQHIIGRASLYLPANSKATSKGRRFLVNIKAPVFHGKGLLLSGVKATTGFIYKGLGCVSEPVSLNPTRTGMRARARVPTGAPRPAAPGLSRLEAAHGP